MGAQAGRLLAATLAGLISGDFAHGHSGGTDAAGGHIDHSTGLYHMHRGSNDGRVRLPSPPSFPAGIPKDKPLPKGGRAAGLDELVSARQFSGECIKVIDGDSITVMKPYLGGRVSIELRLAGIDAPDEGRPLADEGRQALADMILHRVVYVDVRGSDGFNVVADVYLEDATLVNAKLVRGGHAWWFEPRDPDNLQLRDLQASARTAGNGVWAASKPRPPWESRPDDADDGHWATWPALGMPSLLPPETTPAAAASPERQPRPRSPQRQARLERQIAALEAEILRLEVEMRAAEEAHEEQLADLERQLSGPMTNADRSRLELQRTRLERTHERDQKQRASLLSNSVQRLEQLPAIAPDVGVEVQTVVDEQASHDGGELKSENGASD